MRRLTPREKLLFFGLGGLLSVSILWLQVWQPALATKRDSLAQLAKIDAIEGLLNTLPRSIAPKETLEPLRQRVTDAARDAGLEIRRLDPQGTALSVSLDKATFAALIAWVEMLSTTAGIRV